MAQTALSPYLFLVKDAVLVDEPHAEHGPSWVCMLTIRLSVFSYNLLGYLFFVRTAAAGFGAPAPGVPAQFTLGRQVRIRQMEIKLDHGDGRSMGPIGNNWTLGTVDLVDGQQVDTNHTCIRFLRQFFFYQYFFSIQPPCMSLDSCEVWASNLLVPRSS